MIAKRAQTAGQTLPMLSFEVSQIRSSKLALCMNEGRVFHYPIQKNICSFAEAPVPVTIPIRDEGRLS